MPSSDPLPREELREKDRGISVAFGQVHTSKILPSSFYKDLSTSYPAATSLIPLTVIARRLLCCLRTNRSGRCVTQPKLHERIASCSKENRRRLRNGRSSSRFLTFTRSIQPPASTRQVHGIGWQRAGRGPEAVDHLGLETLEHSPRCGPYPAPGTSAVSRRAAALEVGQLGLDVDLDTLSEI